MAQTVSRRTAEDSIFMDCALTYYEDATISGATNTNPVVLTVDSSHTLEDADTIYIYGVEGMLQLNGRSFLVTVSGDQISLYDTDGYPLDGTTFGTYSSGGTTEKWAQIITGLEHLEGETVTVNAEGAVHPDVTVINGAITLQYPVKKAHVGLAYSSYLQTMDIESGSEIGTAQGKRKKIHQLTLRLYQTIGCKIGTTADDLEIVHFRNSSMPMNEAPDLFTGDKRVAFPRGYDRAQTIMVASEQPLPFSLLALVPYMTTSDSA